MNNVSNVRQSPVICLSVHVKTCSFLRTFWQVTSPVSTGTARRQNSNRHGGRVPRLRNQRRGARCEAKQRSCYWRFFLILRVSYTTRTPIWGYGGHQTKFDEDTIRHPERGVRKMFPTVAETLGEVCSCGRELCWRQVGLKPHKPYLLHVSWSVRICFEQTSWYKVNVSRKYNGLSSGRYYVAWDKMLVTFSLTRRKEPDRKMNELKDRIWGIPVRKRRPHLCRKMTNSYWLPKAESTNIPKYLAPRCLRNLLEL